MGNPEAIAKAFGRRLRELMQARGLTSDTARSGVDVRALASATGISYEMARRYAEGLAVPRPETLQRIAGWLSTSAGSLVFGASEEGAAIHAEVLQSCLQAVIEAQAKNRAKVSTEKAAALVAALYQEAIDGRPPLPATVERMLKAMQ
jgi:transcriptional regulator with XRE-family HTH domain